MVLDAVRFIFFSAIEFYALLLLLLSMFGFKVELYKKEIAITVLAMSVLSYILYAFDSLGVLIFIQVITLNLLMRYAFNEKKWLYVFWIVLFGYIIYSIIQTIYVLLCIKTGLYSSYDEARLALTFKANLSQVLCASVALLIAKYNRMHRQWFHFVFRKTNSSTNIYIQISFISMIVLGISSFAINYAQMLMYVLVILLILMITLSILIFYSYQRDKDEYDFSKMTMKAKFGREVKVDEERA